MGKMLRLIQSNTKKLELRISGTQNLPKIRILGSLANKSSKKTLESVTSMKLSLVATGDIGVFLLTSLAALEIVRSFSSAHICQPFQRTQDTSDGMEDWLVKLHQELEKQGITLPERINKDELHRFYAVSDGDFEKFLSSVEKTIKWRKEYTFLSEQELEAWGDLVFWHECYDMMDRPSLIIRIGHACSNWYSHDQAQFIKAIVSQVEYGVMDLLDVEHTQITILMDCGGLLPFGSGIQTFKSCVVLLQDHYPNRLGCLLVVRLPSVVGYVIRMIIHGLEPGTLEKVRILDGYYKWLLSRYFEVLPTFPPRPWMEIEIVTVCILLIYLCVAFIPLILKIGYSSNAL